MAVLRETPSAAGSLRSQPAISSPVSEFSVRLPQYGRMNRRIRYSRFAVVLGPTSCRAVQRPIQSLTVISTAPGSVHVPARTFASWSRPQPSAACFVSKPDWLASPPGILYFTRHGLGPLPRLCSNSTRTSAARAMRPILPGLAVTCWSVFHRWVNSAKPRSPRHRTDRSSALRARVSMSSSLSPAGFFTGT